MPPPCGKFRLVVTFSARHTRHMRHTMRIFSGLLALAVMGMFGVGSAEAQIVTITASGYVAPNGNIGPKADPQGTWGKPADNNPWKVACDYGTVTNGTFTFNFAIGTGFDTPLGKAVSGTWGPIGAEALQNPLPANTHIRARLQKKVGNAWVDQGNPAYFPIP
jgi:hypothetical protein